MVLMRRVSVQLSSLYCTPWVKNGCIFKYILYIPAITVNNMVFQGMTPCGLVEICQGVGGTYRLHFPSFSWVVLAPNDMLAVLCPLLVTLYSPVEFNLLFPLVFLGTLAGSLPCPTISHFLPCRTVYFSVVPVLYPVSSSRVYSSPTHPPTLPLDATAALPV